MLGSSALFPRYYVGFSSRYHLKRSLNFMVFYFFQCQSNTLEGRQRKKDLTRFLANFFLSFKGISDPIVFFSHNKIFVFLKRKERKQTLMLR